MSYLSPNVILSTLIRAYKVRSKRILTESEQALISSTARSIPLNAFNFNSQQIALTLFHLSHIKSKSTTNNCFHSLIQRFITIPNTLSNPYLTLPILHSINHSKILPRQSGVIHKFISNILKPEIITQYLDSITNIASLIYLVDSISRSVEPIDESHFYQLKLVISQILDHFSHINIYDKDFSESDSIASLVTLLTLGSYYGLDILKYSTFLPLLLRIDLKIFPKYTLVDFLEIANKNPIFDEFCTFVLEELSGFDDLSDCPRHLLQRILFIASSRNWKNLKLLDNISRVLCETSHTNIGISSIIDWLQAFKKLNYQNKSALELLLRHSLGVKGGSDKYPIIYQLFKDLQFDHFLLSRLQVLAIHSNTPIESESPNTSNEINFSDKKETTESKLDTESFSKVPEVDIKSKPGVNIKKFSKLTIDKDHRHMKSIRKAERNKDNIDRFWKIRSRKFIRRNIKDNAWRLSVSGNLNYEN